MATLNIRTPGAGLSLRTPAAGLSLRIGVPKPPEMVAFLTSAGEPFFTAENKAFHVKAA